MRDYSAPVSAPPPAIGVFDARLRGGYAVLAIQTAALQLATLAIVCVLVLFVGLGTRSLWDIDEGMHAVIASNMLASGNWIVPMFNGEPFFDKPPLYNWLTAASMVIFGHIEFAVRLPAALLGTGCVFLTYEMGRRMAGPLAGFVAGLVLVTSLEFIVVSRMVQYDIPFAFFTTLALYFLYRVASAPRPARWHMPLFYISCSLAMLTKGPIGAVIPLLVAGTYCLLPRSGMSLRDLRLPMGLPVLLVTTAPWYLAMEYSHPGYLEYFLYNQHIANVIGAVGAASARHPEPLYYFLPVILAGMFPWSLMLVPAIAQAVRDKTDPHLMLVVTWFAVVLILFSVASSKLSTYVLPLFPAAALLLGVFVASFLQKGSAFARVAFVGSVTLASVLVLAFASYAIANDPWKYWEQEVGLSWQTLEYGLIVLFTMTLTTAICGWKGKTSISLTGFAAMGPAIVLFVLLFLVPAANPFNSAREIGRAIDQVLAPGERIVFGRRILDSAMFYTGREALLLPTPDDVERYLASPKQVFVVLSQDSKKGSADFSGNFHIIQQFANKAIVSNRVLEPVAGAGR